MNFRISGGQHWYLARVALQSGRRDILSRYPCLRLPCGSLSLSWTDNISSGRIAIYWPGGWIGCSGMLPPGQVPENFEIKGCTFNITPVISGYKDIEGPSFLIEGRQGFRWLFAYGGIFKTRQSNREMRASLPRGATLQHCDGG